MTRVLVTGGTGFVGSNAVKLYADWHGLDVTATGRRPPERELPGRFVELDLLDRSSVRASIRAARPDLIVHTAILNDFATMYDDRRLAWDVYVEATRSIVDAANEVDAVVVFVSTDWVFDGMVACRAGHRYAIRSSSREPGGTRYLLRKRLRDHHACLVERTTMLTSRRPSCVSSRRRSRRTSTHARRRPASAFRRSAENHMVVMPDADLDKAADAMVSGAYGSSGQRCMAVTTVVAVCEIADELVRKAVERAERMVVGPGSEEQSDIGPVSTPQAFERILGLIERGEATAASLVLDGRPADAEGPGFFIGPCLFDDVAPDMEIYREEIFGPVLIVVRVATLDEALDLIRSNPYGNGSSIFTSSGATAQRFRERTTTGGVGINVPIPVPLSYYPLGGWKASRYGVHGVNFGGFEFFTRRQTTTVRWEAVAARRLRLPDEQLSSGPACVSWWSYTTATPDRVCSPTPPLATSWSSGSLKRRRRPVPTSSTPRSCSVRRRRSTRRTCIRGCTQRRSSWGSCSRRAPRCWASASAPS